MNKDFLIKNKYLIGSSLAIIFIGIVYLIVKKIKKGGVSMANKWGNDKDFFTKVFS